MKELVEKFKVLIFDKDTQELLCVKYFDNSPNEVELVSLLLYYQNIDNKKAKDLEIRIDQIYILNNNVGQKVNAIRIDDKGNEAIICDSKGNPKEYIGNSNGTFTEINKTENDCLKIIHIE